MLSAIIFIDVLWVVGGDLTIHFSGRTLSVPGYLVVAAVLYAAFTTSAMLFIGRRLVPVVEAKNQAEAELRHAATRLHQNALRGGERRESAGMASSLSTSLGQVITQWRHLCAQLMRTILISHMNSLLSPFVGLILCVQKYLADMMTLGEVTQAAAAFFAVQAAFNWLVDNYPRLADWRSSVATLLVSLDAVDGLEQGPHSGRGPRAEEGASRSMAIREH